MATFFNLLIEVTMRWQHAYKQLINIEIGIYIYLRSPNVGVKSDYAKNILISE